MSIHAHSIAAFHAEAEHLSARARNVLEYIRRNGPATDRQTAYALGFGENLNAVRPRVTELISARRLAEVRSVLCAITGKRVRVVDVVRDNLFD